MTGEKNTSKYLDHLLYLLYLVFFVSVICSYRGISSIAIALLIVTGLIKNKTETGSLFNKNLKNGFILCCCIFYMLQAASLLYTNNFPESITHLRIKSALILVPFAICCCSFLNALTVKNLIKFYIWIAFAVMLYCIAISLHRYFFLHQGSEVFFYHELVSPFKQNAVQVSILIFIGLIHLLENIRRNVHPNKVIHFLLIFYFIFCILLLSSKLVIIFSAACIFYYFIISFRKKQRKLLLTISSIFICAAIMMVLLAQNPVSKRFNEIISGNISLVQQGKFSPAIYFNGLQFRLLQWRFVPEILSENNAWLAGVSIGDAQTLLDQKYISTNMYIGERKDGGFLGYDTHNQFLQAILQTGILGLLAFIAVCYSMSRLPFKAGGIELSFIVVLIIIYSFTESCFESQYGLILFTFFPLFIYYGKRMVQHEV